jgi:Domain of unknown function (DUF6894)
MSRYYFHLTNGENNILIEDEDGEAFALLAEAQQNAMLIVRELQGHSSLDGRSITVTDEVGVVVFKLPI